MIFINWSFGNGLKDQFMLGLFPSNYELPHLSIPLILLPLSQIFCLDEAFFANNLEHCLFFTKWQKRNGVLFRNCIFTPVPARYNYFYKPKIVYFMKSKLYLFATLSFLAVQNLVQAQLYIDAEIPVDTMVMDFFDGECVTVSNIVYTGADASSAYFEAANTDLNIPAGIFIGTGMAQDVIGPDTFISSSMGTDGDPDLGAEVFLPTFDAAVIEMDIVSSEDNTLNFYYIFGSEEYNEWVGSGFNDVFAFYVSGPGINGVQNIATVPGTVTPASINAINLDTNSVYYVDYIANGGTDTSLDGISTQLPATFTALANETYHIKIAVADVSDAIFDTGVFIGVNSLCGDSLVVPPAIALISQDGNTISIANESRYATSYFWDFGDQTTSTERHPGQHTYTQDGVYTVQLITQNYCCTDTVTTEVVVGSVGIEDPYSTPFQMFPNPVDDILEIQWDGTESYTLEIYDVAGKLLFFEKGAASQSVDFRRFEKGVYFVKINTGASVFTEKVIKN